MPASPPSFERQESTHLPAFTRRWTDEDFGDQPEAVQVRWLSNAEAFSTLGGGITGLDLAAEYAAAAAVNGAPAAWSSSAGSSSVGTSTAGAAASACGGSPSPEARPVVQLKVSFTFACVKCESPLLVTDAAAAKNMVVDLAGRAAESNRLPGILLHGGRSGAAPAVGARAVAAPVYPRRGPRATSASTTPAGRPACG